MEGSTSLSGARTSRGVDVFSPGRPVPGVMLNEMWSPRGLKEKVLETNQEADLWRTHGRGRKLTPTS